MRLLWLTDAARATGYPVHEVSGWKTRGSDSFSPKGLIWHHTAGPSTGDMPSLNTLVNGRSDLPGPLAQYGLGRSGTIYVVASGKANHAGAGEWKGLSGNASVVGIEAEHTGKAGHPWPDVQLDAYRKLSAEILVRLGVSADFLAGHKEWAPTRKIDPISLNMRIERQRVAALMEEEVKIPRPSWFGQEIVDRLAQQNIAPRSEETEDMWRFLAFLDRHTQKTAGSAGVDPIARSALQRIKETI